MSEDLRLPKNEDVDLIIDAEFKYYSTRQRKLLKQMIKNINLILEKEGLEVGNGNSGRAGS